MRAAEDPDEVAALELRYQQALSNAASRGAHKNLSDFEAAVANSVVVAARSPAEVERLVSNENELYATYYKLIEAGVRIPEGDKWDSLRRITDSALFPGYEKEIRFASLSLDGIGLSNYGECSMVFRTDMIAHRATVFEENSVLFMDHRNIRMRDAANLPLGHRATWQDRGKLCVAKLFKSIDPSTRPDEYSELLLRQGATSEDDECVEVHIWGPMTVLTIEQVTLTQRKKTSPAKIKALREKLTKAGATLKVK